MTNELLNEVKALQMFVKARQNYQKIQKEKSLIQDDLRHAHVSELLCRELDPVTERLTEILNKHTNDKEVRNPEP